MHHLTATIFSFLVLFSAEVMSNAMPEGHHDQSNGHKPRHRCLTADEAQGLITLWDAMFEVNDGGDRARNSVTDDFKYFSQSLNAVTPGWALPVRTMFFPQVPLVLSYPTNNFLFSSPTENKWKLAWLYGAYIITQFTDMNGYICNSLMSPLGTEKMHWSKLPLNLLQRSRSPISPQFPGTMAVTHLRGVGIGSCCLGPCPLRALTWCLCRKNHTCLRKCTPSLILRCTYQRMAASLSVACVEIKAVPSAIPAGTSSIFEWKSQGLGNEDLDENVHTFVGYKILTTNCNQCPRRLSHQWLFLPVSRILFTTTRWGSTMKMSTAWY